MSKVLNVFNTRNGKYGTAQQVDESTIRVWIEGKEKDISAKTFKNWYKEVEAKDIQESATPAPTPEAEIKEVYDQITNPETQADVNTEEVIEKLGEVVDELQKKAEEVEATPAPEKSKSTKKSSKKIEKDNVVPFPTPEVNPTPEEAPEKKSKSKKKEKAPAPTPEADPAPKEKKKSEKKTEAPAPKVKSEVNAKQRNKEFFTKFMEALNAKDPSISKANAREKNYMNFPAGASGIKYKWFFTGSKLECSLYFFGGSELVTTSLFKALEAHKETITNQLDMFDLEWKSEEGQIHRRVSVTFTGAEAHLIERGVEALIRFKEVFTPILENILA
jgi:hypothetical protein